MLLRLIFISIFLCICASCATYIKQNIDIEFKDRQTLSFTGKGAAAGIMLDSVLGGAGIAIGIAIDEGIAKDIAKSINTYDPNYDFLRVVDSELQTRQKNIVASKFLLTKVTVIRYGFRTIPHAEISDAVTPCIGLSLDCSGSVKEISYPEDTTQSLAIELQDAKTNGELTARQLQLALGQLIGSWLDKGGCNPI